MTSAWERWRADSTLPHFPEICPECRSEVGVYHMNIETKAAIFLCKDQKGKKCFWPAHRKKLEQYYGTSDAELYYDMLVERGVEISDGEDEDIEGIDEDKDVKAENGEIPQAVTSPCPDDHNNDLEYASDSEPDPSFWWLPSPLSPMWQSPRFVTPSPRRDVDDSFRSPKYLPSPRRDTEDIFRSPRYLHSPRRDAVASSPKRDSESTEGAFRTPTCLPSPRRDTERVTHPPASVQTSSHIRAPSVITPLVSARSPRHCQSSVADPIAAPTRSPARDSSLTSGSPKTGGGRADCSLTRSTLLSTPTRNHSSGTGATPVRSARSPSVKVTPVRLPTLLSPMPATPRWKHEDSLSESDSEKQSSATPAKILEKSFSEDSEPEKCKSNGKVNSPKTYSSSRSSTFKLQSLSNRLAMASGVPIQVSVDFPETSRFNIREVADMARQAQIKLESASRGEDELEFRKLLKAMEPKDVDNVDFIKRIQNSLKRTTGPSTVTVHVGQKASIDLSTDALDLNNDIAADGAQLRLCAKSDGIEFQGLKEAGAQAQIKITSTRRRSVRRVAAVPTRIPTSTSQDPTLSFEDLPAYASAALPLLPLQAPDPPQDAHLFVDPVFLANFRYTLEILSAGFCAPEAWSAVGVDPVVVMLVTRKHDPAFAAIDCDALLDLYVRLINYEMQVKRWQEYEQQQQKLIEQQRKQQQLEKQLQQKQQEQGRPTDDQQQQHQYSRVHEKRDNLKVVYIRRPSSRCDSTPAPVKDEVLELPSQYSSSGSVAPTSVLAAPGSVQEVPPHLQAAAAGRVGTGPKVVSCNFENTTIGPIHVRTDEEVHLVGILITEKIKERRHRGQSLASSPGYSSAALMARSKLLPDVVRYIDWVFTEKGLRNSVVGRQKRNYPKRSQIIKTNPVTGLAMYLPGHPMANAIKIERLDEGEVTATASPSTSQKKYIPSTPNNQVNTEVIDQILSSSHQNVEAQSPSLLPTSRKRPSVATEQQKRPMRQQQQQQQQQQLIAKATFPEKKPRKPEQTVKVGQLTAANLAKQQTDSNQKLGLKLVVGGKETSLLKRYAGFGETFNASPAGPDSVEVQASAQRASPSEKRSKPPGLCDKNEDVIDRQVEVQKNLDRILSLSTSTPSASSPPAPQSATQGPSPTPPGRQLSRRHANSKTISSPAAKTALSASNLFVRSSHESKVKRALAARLRKEEKAATKKYAGYGEETPKPKREARWVFFKAEAAKVAEEPATTTTLAADATATADAAAAAAAATATADCTAATRRPRKMAQTSQEEQDLMTELFQVADDLFADVAGATTPGRTETEQAGDAGAASMPSFEDIFM